MSGEEATDEEDSRELVGIVHLAWDKLMADELDDALKLLHSVRQRSADYSSYHVVMASAMLSMKQYPEALAAAERALVLMPDSAHARLIFEIASERLPGEVRGRTVIDGGAQHQASRRPLAPDPPKLAMMLDPLPEGVPMPHGSRVAEPTTEFNIDRTADELTRERPLVRPIPEPEHIQPPLGQDPDIVPALVSETLADIMIRQGKLTDAKKVYIQLSRMQPERYSHFRTKIEAIDRLLLGTDPPQRAPETDNDHVV